MLVLTHLLPYGWLGPVVRPLPFLRRRCFSEYLGLIEKASLSHQIRTSAASNQKVGMSIEIQSEQDG